MINKIERKRIISAEQSVINGLKEKGLIRMSEKDIQKQIILKKATVWAEIKAKEREYKRISIEVDYLKQTQQNIVSEVKNKYDEIQSLSEQFDEIAENNIHNF